MFRVARANEDLFKADLPIDSSTFEAIYYPAFIEALPSSVANSLIDQSFKSVVRVIIRSYENGVLSNEEVYELLQEICSRYAGIKVEKLVNNFLESHINWHYSGAMKALTHDLREEKDARKKTETQRGEA